MNRNIIILITIVIVLAGAGYFYFARTTPVTIHTPPTQTSVQIPAIDEAAGWKTYTNAEFGFMVRYPKDWRAPERFGGVNTPDGKTYKIENATAYEWVFTFIPSRIDDFPVIITIYELSGTDSDTSAIREKVIANLWGHCGDKNLWPECKKDVTRQMITVSGSQALLVTVTATDNKDRLQHNFVFIEKANRIYEMVHSGTSSNDDFKLFYRSFALTKSVEGRICGGGIMANQAACPDGYICKYLANHELGALDGTCVKN